MLLATLCRVSVVTSKIHSWICCLVHPVNVGCVCTNFLLNNPTEKSVGERQCSIIKTHCACEKRRVGRRTVIQPQLRWRPGHVTCADTYATCTAIATHPSTNSTSWHSFLASTNYQTGLHDFSITLYKCDMYYTVDGDYTVLLYTLLPGESTVRIVDPAASKLAMPVSHRNENTGQSAASAFGISETNGRILVFYHKLLTGCIEYTERV